MRRGSSSGRVLQGDRSNQSPTTGSYIVLNLNTTHRVRKDIELFGLLREVFEPVDVISVVRHNKTLEMGNYRRAAEEGNFYLRGFNYLFVMRKAAVG